MTSAPSLLSIVVLAVGMTVFTASGIYVSRESSVDAFHENADRIGAVVLQTNGPLARYARYTPRPLKQALSERLPYVERSVQTSTRTTRSDISPEEAPEKRIDNQEVLSATSEFFEVFSFDLVRGTANEVLDNPRSAVITLDTSEKLFGDLKNPIGRRIQITNSSDAEIYTVTGVLSHVPKNSTFRYDVVVSAQAGARSSGGSWNISNWHTYSLLKAGTDMRRFSEDVDSVFRESHRVPTETKYSAVRIDRLYLSKYYEAGDVTGTQRLVYLFGVTGLLTLLVSAINFVNISYAEGAKKARSIGVRRSLGASKIQVGIEAAIEPAIYAMAAQALSVVAVVAILALYMPEYYATLIGFFDNVGVHVLKVSLISLVLVSLIAVYPYISFTRLEPVRILRGESSGIVGGGKGLFRQGLMIFQFTVTVALLMFTVIIASQLYFLLDPNLGFHADKLVAIELPLETSEERKKQIKTLLHQSSAVEHVTVAGAIPSRFNNAMVADLKDLAPTSDSDEQINLFLSEVDDDYISTLGITLAAGRNFRESDDPEHAFIINQTAARALGWSDENAVGKPFHLMFGDMGQVIGVVNDFHIASMRSRIKPVVLVQESSSFSSSPMVTVRFAESTTSSVMRSTLERITENNNVKVNRTVYVDRQFDSMYKSEVRIGTAILVISALTIVIASLGLYGFLIVVIRRRWKEMAIRRALGATPRDILALMSSEVTFSVVCSVLLGGALSWYFGSVWLQQFAYRIDGLTPSFLSSTVLFVLVVSVVVVLTSNKIIAVNPGAAIRSI
jgi:putative ABC transport system permease protein